MNFWIIFCSSIRQKFSQTHPSLYLTGLHPVKLGILTSDQHVIHQLCQHLLPHLSNPAPWAPPCSSMSSTVQICPFRPAALSADRSFSTHYWPQREADAPQQHIYSLNYLISNPDKTINDTSNHKIANIRPIISAPLATLFIHCGFSVSMEKCPLIAVTGFINSVNAKMILSVTAQAVLRFIFLIISFTVRPILNSGTIPTLKCF